MVHIIILLISVVIWVRICITSGKQKARSTYPLYTTELATAQNGIRWLKANNLNKLRFEQLFYGYVLVIGLKLIYMHFFPLVYSMWLEKFIMIGSVMVLPLALFPYFHDKSYYKEYNRLLKCTYDEPWYFEHNIIASLPQVGNYERLVGLIAGLVLLVTQLLIIIFY